MDRSVMNADRRAARFSDCMAWGHVTRSGLRVPKPSACVRCHPILLVDGTWATSPREWREAKARKVRAATAEETWAYVLGSPVDVDRGGRLF